MTVFLVIFIAAVSILAFYNDGLFSWFRFNPYLVHHKREWHRLLSHGFVHADWIHLAVNLMVLFFFGTSVEHYFGQMETAGIIRFPMVHFMVLFLGSMVVSSLLTLGKHRNDPWYNSVGASGAVSAMVFTSIFLDPWQTLLVYFIPVPGIIFGVVYLVYSHIMSRRSRDNVNHDAHFIGAVFGFVYPAVIAPSLIGYFFQQLFRL